MLETQELVNLISIRDFLARTLDNLTVKLSSAEQRAVSNKIAYLNDKILKKCLALSVVDQNVKVENEMVFVSTEALDKVLEKAISDSEKSKPRIINSLVTMSEDGSAVVVSTSTENEDAAAKDEAISTDAEQIEDKKDLKKKTKSKK